MKTIDGIHKNPQERHNQIQLEWFDEEKFEEILKNDEGWVRQAKYALIKEEPYAPKTSNQLELFLEEDEPEIIRKIALAKKYEEEYGMQTIEFEDYYKYLWEPDEELREKLELLKKPYAPKFVLLIEKLNKLTKEEIEIRNKTVEELGKYGIKIRDFLDFTGFYMPNITKELENNEELKNRLEELKWGPDAPKSVWDLIRLSLSLENVSREFLITANLYLTDKEDRAKISGRLMELE